MFETNLFPSYAGKLKSQSDALCWFYIIYTIDIMVP